MHTHCASAAQGRVKHIVAADNGTTVGLCGFVAGRFAPGLEHHHGLGVGRHAQRTHETPRAGDALQVDHDAVRLRIVGQEVQYLRNIDTGMRAQRHHR